MDDGDVDQASTVRNIQKDDSQDLIGAVANEDALLGTSLVMMLMGKFCIVSSFGVGGQLNAKWIFG